MTSIPRHGPACVCLLDALDGLAVRERCIPSARVPAKVACTEGRRIGRVDQLADPRCAGSSPVPYARGSKPLCRVQRIRRVSGLHAFFSYPNGGTP